MPSLTWPPLPHDTYRGTVLQAGARSQVSSSRNKDFLIDLGGDIDGQDLPQGTDVIVLRYTDYLKLKETPAPQIRYIHTLDIILANETQMAIDITDFLNESVSTIQPPVVPPDGHYIGQVKGKTFSEKNTDEGKVLVIDFEVALLEPCEDVPYEELQAAGGLRRKDGSPITSRYSVWLRKDANVDPLNRLLRVAKKTFDFDPDTTTKKDLIEMFVGNRFRFQAVAKPSNDGERFLNLTKMYALSDNE